MDEEAQSPTDSFRSEDNPNPKDFQYSEDEKRLVKKLSWTLLPLVWAIVFVQFIDKTILSVAAGTGLLPDTHINKSQYSWASSVIYLGYLVYQVPNNILIQRLPLSRYLGVLIFLWGIVVSTTCLVKNFQQLMAVRFLLGLLEAGSNPILYIILNSLYRRSEQSAVFGFILISSGSGTSVGAAIGFGIVQTLDYVGGWRAWRWSYLIFGVSTIALGIAVFFLLIDKPTSRLLRLTDTEREIIRQRTNDNMVVKSKKIKKDQIFEALKEPRFWCICLAVLFNNMENGGMISYAVILVQGLGFNSEQSILLQIPSGAASVLFIFIAIFLSRRFNQTIYTAIFSTFISLIGLIILLATESNGAKLAGYYLTWAGTAGMAMMITIVGNNVSGYTKKVTYNSGIVVANTLGNFIGPLVMAESMMVGIIVFFVVNVMIILLLLFIRWSMLSTNNKRKDLRSSEKTDPNLDYTDRQDVNFVYRL
ncbi:major facilitator superfamily domain-containing protein [Chlamydoabsidia padenii]|nr:major facilitator superfamily domain-containing protein [Chlamydoabsidia padenii]